MPAMPLPPLRSSLKIVPAKHDGREIFVATDSQEQLIEKQIALPPMAFVVGALLDGRREVADVRAAIQEQLKVDVSDDEVETVVRDLDQHLLLESARARTRRRELEDEFRNAPRRAVRFVPGPPEDISRALDGMYAAEAGAGLPGPARPEPLAGILAPHIDFARGGTCYTHAYRQLAERSRADLYLILGVAHLSPPSPFVFTSKDYDTAFGPLRSDREALALVEKRLGPSLYEHEAVHRSEHSAEFQAVFLRHARPKDDFTVLPVLVSAFEQWCGDASPSTSAELEDALGALREALAGRNVAVVAGVDFAHVGPVFGDDVEVDQKLVDWMMSGDTRGLQTCAEGNPEAFWNSVMSDGNARHVCGLSATYAALRLMPGAAGRVHKYGFAPDPAGGIVSFGAMSFAPAAP
jgi:AmmeMemoRadiSam system protein B